MEEKAFEYFHSNSKVQEIYAEYSFLKDLIIEAANIHETIAISRSDFDSFGFDLLLARKVNGCYVTRQVQMKARGGGVDGDGYWDVHKSLLQSPEGKIVVVRLELLNQKITPKYKLFDAKHSNIAMERKAKVSNEMKCQVKEFEFVEITGNLLSIF